MRTAVVTGGPGVGKTTLIHSMVTPTIIDLTNDRIAVTPDPTALIIPEFAEEVIREGTIMPGSDHLAFQREVARRQLAAEAKIAGFEGVVYLDRGLHDAVAYRLIHGWELVGMHHRMMETPRYDVAYILEPLEMFENNGIRYEDLDFARELTSVLTWVYDRAGVPVVLVPNTSVAERKRFIMETTESPRSLPIAPRIQRDCGVLVTA